MEVASKRSVVIGCPTFGGPETDMQTQGSWKCTVGETGGRSGASAPVLLTLLALSACTTTMYGGRSRSSKETAIIASGRGATIESIDGTPVNGGAVASYEVLPGPHNVGLAGRKVDMGLFSNTVHTSGWIGTCFSAKPGHVYDVRAFLDDEFWRNDVIDRRSQTNVERFVCGGSSEPPPWDRSSAAVLPRKPHPGTGISIGLGGEGGGDNLVRATMSSGDTETLNAGSGFIFTMGGSAMPLWIGNILGFGVAGRIGVKIDSIDAKNGSIRLISYPLSLWIQSYLAVSERWFLSFSGGGHKELNPHLSGDGVASDINANFESPWGWLIDGGVLFAETWHIAMGFTLRYTKIHYIFDSINGRKNIDASNVGAALTFHFNL